MKDIKGGILEENIPEIRESNEFRRTCKKCNKTKSFKRFSFRRMNGKAYFMHECNKCSYKRKLEAYNNNMIEYTKTQRDKENFTIKGRARMLRNRCKQRAKRYNMEFNLSLDKVIELLKIGKCSVTSINLIMDDSTYNPYAPSIDRIDNSIGYTDDNIQITCMIYNFCKNKFNDEQVVNFIKNAKV